MRQVGLAVAAVVLAMAPAGVSAWQASTNKPAAPPAGQKPASAGLRHGCGRAEALAGRRSRSSWSRP